MRPACETINLESGIIKTKCITSSSRNLCSALPMGVTCRLDHETICTSLSSSSMGSLDMRRLLTKEASTRTTSPLDDTALLCWRTSIYLTLFNTWFRVYESTDPEAVACAERSQAETASSGSRMRPEIEHHIRSRDAISTLTILITHPENSKTPSLSPCD